MQNEYDNKLFIHIYHWKFKVKKSNLIYPDSHRQFEHSVVPMKPLFAPASDLFTNFIKKGLHPFPCIYKELPGPLWQSS